MHHGVSKYYSILLLLNTRYIFHKSPYYFFPYYLHISLITFLVTVGLYYYHYYYPCYHLCTGYLQSHIGNKFLGV